MAALTLHRPPWTPAAHARWPPAFCTAARAVLLAAARHGRTTQLEEKHGGGRRVEGSGNSANADLQLGALPEGALLCILATAAYPVSAWLG